MLVFTISCLTLVLLRLPIMDALDYWRALFMSPLGPLPDARCLLFMLPSIWLDWMQARQGEDTVFMSWPRLARATLLAIAMLLWLAMSWSASPAPRPRMAPTAASPSG